MTFKEWLKQKKGIDADEKNLFEYMDDYYDDYLAYMRGTKDGCAPK